MNGLTNVHLNDLVNVHLNDLVNVRLSYISSERLFDRSIGHMNDHDDAKARSNTRAIQHNMLPCCPILTTGVP